MLRKILYTGIDDGMDGYMRDKVYLSNAIAILLEFIGLGFYRARSSRGFYDPDCP